MIRRVKRGDSARRFSPIRALLLIVLFLPAAAAAADKPQGDEFEEVRTDSLWVIDMVGDSVWVDSLDFDSIRTVVLEDSLSKIPSVRISDAKTGFHPTYKLRSSRIRKTTVVEQEFLLDYLLADNLATKTKATWQKNRSERAGRETNIRKINTNLQYLVREGLKIGLKCNRDDNRSIQQLVVTDIVVNRLSLQSTFIQNLGNAYRVTATLEGGIDNRDKDKETESSVDGSFSTETEEKRGNSVIGSLGFRYSPRTEFEIDLKGDASRKGFSINTTGGTQTDGTSKDNRDRSEKISARVRYEDFEFAKMSLQFSADESGRQFVRPAGGIETTKDRRRNATFNMKGVFGDRSSYDSKVNYAWGRRDFAIDKNQSSERLDFGADAGFGYQLPVGVKSKLILKRSVLEDTYFTGEGEPGRTGKTDRGNVSINLMRTFWTSTKVRTSASVGMVSRVFVDSTQDKDNLNQRVSLNLDYASPSKFKGSALVSLEEGKAVSIHNTRSNNNETRQTWRVSPTVEYVPFPGLSLKSIYTMTFVYIFKEFDSSKNTMTRISELRSTIGWDFARAARFDFEYRFKLDESGSFEKVGASRRFARDREGSNQKLNLRLRYNVFRGLSVESGQFVQVEKQYDLIDGKDLSKHTNKTQIYNKVSFRRDIRENTTISITMKQIQDAKVPLFTDTGSLRDEERRIEWELTGSLSIKL